MRVRLSFISSHTKKIQVQHFLNELKIFTLSDFNISLRIAVFTLPKKKILLTPSGLQNRLQMAIISKMGIISTIMSKMEATSKLLKCH